MKTKLHQITLSDFVELYCGNGTVLIEEGESPSKIEIDKTRVEILLEYRSVVDVAGYKSVLNKQKSSIVSKTRIAIFKMCINLICVGGISNVRDVYNEMKLSHNKLNDDQLIADVKRRLKAAEFDYKRECEANEHTVEESELSSPDDRRDAMIDDMAYVMTHFKFQIDPSKLNARAYATMRRSMIRELEAKKKSLNSLKSRRH